MRHERARASAERVDTQVAPIAVAPLTTSRSPGVARTNTPGQTLVRQATVHQELTDRGLFLGSQKETYVRVAMCKFCIHKHRLAKG